MVETDYDNPIAKLAALQSSFETDMKFLLSVFRTMNSPLSAHINFNAYFDRQTIHA